jgi:hypothetical protein
MLSLLLGLVVLLPQVTHLATGTLQDSSKRRTPYAASSLLKSTQLWLASV